MFLFFLLVQLGTVFYLAFRADRAEKDVLNSLSMTDSRVTQAVPIIPDGRLSPRTLSASPFYDSDTYIAAKKILSYMQDHPCDQYRTLESCYNSTAKNKYLANLFLLWFFQTDTVIRLHQSFDCTDISRAFNVFIRYYSGEFAQKKQKGHIIIPIKIAFFLLCWYISWETLDLGILCYVLMLVVTPFELIYGLRLQVKCCRQLFFYEQSDFIIENKLASVCGVSAFERMANVYFAATAAKTMRKLIR